MERRLNRDYNDILSALSAEGAEFLIVGAYALAAHGIPRATGDIDIWVRPTPENAMRVMRALKRFGAALLDLTEDDLATADTVFQMGVAPSRIDMMTGISGVTFEQAWPSRLTVAIEPLPAARRISLTWPRSVRLRCRGSLNRASRAASHYAGWPDDRGNRPASPFLLQRCLPL